MTMAKHRKQLTHRRQLNFILVYESPSDPPRAEVKRALHNFSAFDAEEVLPGTIHVVGEPKLLERAARMLDGWKLAPEGMLSDRQPYKVVGH
jgi:hypothetical protein